MALSQTSPRDARKIDIIGQRLGIRIALALAAVLLLQGLVIYLFSAAEAIAFSDEIDYGEGIVWQQMRMIMSGGGYGSIDFLPAIVFHYPPVYHTSTAALAAATGLDQLAAGRLLSVAATASAAFLAAMIVRHLCRGNADNLACWMCGLLTAMMVFSLSPVVAWSTLMRVDNLAVAFSFAGVYFGIRTLTVPKAVHIAALCFVMAVYTKQTAIAAPAAVFGTLLFLRPRAAVAGILTAIVSGLALLAALWWSTNGGFLRHILWYNVNRFYPDRLLSIITLAAGHALYLAVAAVGVVHRLRKLMAADPGRTGSLRQRLIAAPEDAGYIMVLAYVVATTLMLVTVAKSGSSINYFLEWTCSIVLLAGLALYDSAKAATRVGRYASSTILTLLLPLAVAIQAFILPDAPDRQWLMDSKRSDELNTLGEMVRTASRPVVSDNMVILLRNDKNVQWEPAIFAELSSTGLWEERPIVEKINAGTFAFFITDGVRGEPLFDSRYNPAVADAIDASYPEKRELAGYTLHFPAAVTSNHACRPPICDVK
jgi:hypothetical protein